MRGRKCQPFPAKRRRKRGCGGGRRSGFVKTGRAERRGSGAGAQKGSGADRIHPFGGGKGAAGRMRGGRGMNSDRRTEKSVKFRGGLKYETAAV